MILIGKISPTLEMQTSFSEFRALYPSLQCGFLAAFFLITSNSETKRTLNRNTAKIPALNNVRVIRINPAATVCLFAVPRLQLMNRSAKPCLETIHRIALKRSKQQSAKSCALSFTALAPQLFEIRPRCRLLMLCCALLFTSLPATPTVRAAVKKQK
jgi:hypothetical protein